MNWVKNSLAEEEIDGDNDDDDEAKDGKEAMEMLQEAKKMDRRHADLVKAIGWAFRVPYS